MIVSADQYQKRSLLELSLIAQMKGRVPAPMGEYKFHPSRRWRFDFAWPRKKIAVEVEGGTAYRSRHTTMAGFEADCEKYNEAALMGWTVLRVTSKMVKDGRALMLIERALTTGS